MNLSEKNQAISTISKALAIQFVPILVYAFLVNKGLVVQESVLSGILALLIFGLLIYGFIPFVKGCRRYIHSKGYSSGWGWLGWLSIFGLYFLAIFPPKISRNSEEESSDNPFENLNIIEIIVFYLIFLYVIFYYLIFIYFNLNNWDTLDLFQTINEPIEYIAIFCIILIWFFFIIRDLKIAEFRIKDFIPNLQIPWKIVLKTAIIYTLFYVAFNRLLAYYISFFYPNYIEQLINDSPTNIYFYLTNLLLSISILNIPISLLIFGIILQKYSLKFNRLKVIVFISLILSFSLNISIISSFIRIIILSLLFWQSANLLIPIIFTAIFNILVSAVYLSFYGVDFSALSAIEYRNMHEPFLVLYFILAGISFVLIINFIKKYFPSKDDLIPYYRNRKRLNNYQK